MHSYDSTTGVSCRYLQYLLCKVVGDAVGLSEVREVKLLPLQTPPEARQEVQSNGHVCSDRDP